MENGDSFYMCQMNSHARTDASHAFDHMDGIIQENTDVRREKGFLLAR